jgi:hypothetical protein
MTHGTKPPLPIQRTKSSTSTVHNNTAPKELPDKPASTKLMPARPR